MSPITRIQLAGWNISTTLDVRSRSMVLSGDYCIASAVDLSGRHPEQRDWDHDMDLALARLADRVEALGAMGGAL